MPRTLSLAPDPNNEAEDLAAVLTTPFIMRALREHGQTVTDFEMDMGWHGRDWPRQPTLRDLRDLRDYLGY